VTKETEMTELARVEDVLNSRWPETRIEPSLDRIAHLMTLLGDPQLAYPVIHITGTNGKSSTARMIESLLRARGLTTGLVTSPHLHSINERIQLDGLPVSADTFVRAYDEIEPFLALVDAESINNGGPAMSYFEVLTGLAFAIFADTPIDVAIVEVGMGGTWDATNVVQADVAVVMPIGLDHTEYLGETIADIAGEKAGIIKPGSIAVLAQQQPEAAEVLLRRAVEVEAPVLREGLEFGVVDRALALGGQVITLHGITGDYSDIVLPLFGAHQAANASVALTAVEAFFGGGEPISEENVHTAFASVNSPGRLEVVRRSPTVIVDAAHNPHGAAVLASALEESFTFESIIGVVSIMGDKDVDGILAAFDGLFDQIVVTHNGTPRAMPPAELAERAETIFGSDRVSVANNLAEGISQAVAMADAAGTSGVGVVVTGSVVTAGVARALVGRS
jgi:dihydrofolate synthase / folylpolyglutamate synthase